VDFGYGFYLSRLSKESGLLVLKKQDEYLVSFEDGHTCHIKGIITVHIKMFDGMVRELQDVRYVPQLKKNLSQLEV